ncbi:MAG: flagellar motor protein MotB [Bdellovibrionales bacterium]
MADQKKDNKKDKSAQPIIIKRVKKGGHAHHGGAWKVAYADFVTAMMALFLLLWLLNVTTEEQKENLAAFFIDPSHPKVSRVESGADGVLGGTSQSTVGAMSEMLQPPVPPQLSRKDVPEDANDKDLKQVSEAQLAQLQKEQEDKEFEKTRKKLEDAMSKDPELRELAKHLMVDMTTEGLRIQILDQQGEPMFASGSAQMPEKTRKLMGLVAKIIKGTPNDLSIRGHTDGKPYRGDGSYTNWELSADRANASRRVLLENGVSPAKVSNVVGKADTDHLKKDNPYDSQNRRISIILVRESLSQQGNSDGSIHSNNNNKKASQKPRAYQKSRGAVQFP